MVRTTATFSDGNGFTPIIEQIKDLDKNYLEVLKDDDTPLTTFQTGRLASIDRNVQEEVAVIFYFD